jgi:hypothetical protein
MEFLPSFAKDLLMHLVLFSFRRLLFTTVEKCPICLVMKSPQNFFNGTGAKATDQLQLVPIFPITNCV